MKHKQSTVKSYLEHMITETGTDIKKAEEILRQGGLVAIPTETVYGLAGNALKEETVLSIFRIKNRPLGNPLIIHLHNPSQLKEFVREIPETAQQLMKRFSPGPLTYLLPKTDAISDLITAGSDLVAVRFPDHPLTQSLLRSLDFPLAAPSANKYTMVSPTLPDHVKKQLNGEIAYILDGGACINGIESTVIGFQNNEVIIYRPGIITKEQLSEEGITVRYREKNVGPVSSPGLSALHYSPKTPLYICQDISTEAQKYIGKKIAVIAFSKKADFIPSEQQFILSESGNPQEAASKIYAALHLMDESGADLILTELLPEAGLGAAVNDRLRRAARVAGR